jgi:predicted transcriptional regulator
MTSMKKKKENMVFVGIRLPISMKRKITKIAEAESNSESAVIRRAISFFLKQK